MDKLSLRALRSSVLGTLTLGACVFLPAWTLNYWEGWTYLGVFVVMTTWITIYFLIKDPALIERRMRAGPLAEKEASQRIIMSFATIGFIALIVLPGFDHRLGWSPVSPAVAILGNALVALGFLLFFLVLKQNSYAASTIEVAKEQKVVSTGLYGIVRHPMYAGALPLLIGTPLALGSWSALAALVLILPALVLRLLDEERFLQKNLPGYTEYMRKIRWRLAPGIF